MTINKSHETYNIYGSSESNWNYSGTIIKQEESEVLEIDIVFYSDLEITKGHVTCRRRDFDILDTTYSIISGNEEKFTEYSNIVLKEILEYFS